jgi:hypothetical protein
VRSCAATGCEERIRREVTADTLAIVTAAAAAATATAAPVTLTAASAGAEIPHMEQLAAALEVVAKKKRECVREEFFSSVSGGSDLW